MTRRERLARLCACGVVWALALGWGPSCVPQPGGRPDATPPEVDPASLPPSVVTAELADAVAGAPYGDRLLARDGVPPYTWSVSGPGWLSVEAPTGELSGTAAGAAGGQVTVVATATDTAGRSGSRDLVIRLRSCTPGETLACQVPSGSACRLGQQTCLSDGTWSACDAPSPSTSASACGGSCAVCGPDADRCANGGATCACGASPSACAAGLSCCPGMDGGARCANLGNDPSSCGACGASCTPPPNADSTCDGGVCGAACRPGYAACDGRTLDGCEVDLARDVAHCGSCATVCQGNSTGSPTCDGGACDLACNAANPQHCGLRDCRPHDVPNCGGCGVACPNPGAHAGAPTGCAGPGTCSYTCAPGWGDCNGGMDGCELDVSSDATRCGSCSNNCLTSGYAGCRNSQCYRCYQCPSNPNGAPRTTCCGEHCSLNVADGFYECTPCGVLVDGGC